MDGHGARRRSWMAGWFVIAAGLCTGPGAMAQVLLEQVDPDIMLIPRQVEITEDTPLQVGVEQVSPDRSPGQGPARRAAQGGPGNQRPATNSSGPSSSDTRTISLPRHLPVVSAQIPGFPDTQQPVFPRASVTLVFG